jgi:uncharacterized membrane protein YccF (DUF307 family)
MPFRPEDDRPTTAALVARKAVSATSALRNAADLHYDAAHYGGQAAMRAIGNFLWFIFGGLFLGLSWWLIGVLCFITIVGIPWGRACFVIGRLAFFPFGKEAVNRKDLTLQSDIGTSGWGVLGNVIWFIFAGFWLAISHALTGIVFFVTIIGIPFGFQHMKLAGIAIAPIGKTIVPKEVAAEAVKANAVSSLSRVRQQSQ